MHILRIPVRKPGLSDLIHRPLGVASLHTSRSLLNQKPNEQDEINRAIWEALCAIEQVPPAPRTDWIRGCMLIMGAKAIAKRAR